MGRARLAQIRQAEADLKAKAATPEKRSKSKRNQRGAGRHKQAGSKRNVAEETGISPAEQVRVEKHVAIAEQYPSCNARAGSSITSARIALKSAPLGSVSQRFPLAAEVARHTIIALQNPGGSETL
jgi:hypothetical protein